MASSEFREYENGVADVLASVVGEAGTVRRNVRLPSRSGGRPRQIDVLVEGNISGVTNSRIIVDCKRWKKAIDIADVDAFIGMVDDVGADMGMLVSAAGASDGAASRAQAARGVRVKALSVDELIGWRPPGTVFKTIEVPQARLERATKMLREAGLRVTVKEMTQDCARVEVFRHHGMANPPGEVQQAQHELTDATLDKLQISYRSLGQGVTFGGGTPSHRWLDVRINGNPFVIKVLAATEEELQKQLVMMSSQFGVPVDWWVVERPEGWPFASTFPF